MVSIRVDVRGMDAVQKSLSGLGESLKSKALSAAINKTAAKANTEIKRAVTAEFNISQAEVANSVSIGMARAKPGSVEAVISIFGSRRRKGRSLNVAHFLEKSISMAESKRRAKKGSLFAVGKGGRMLPVLGFKFKKAGGVKNIEGAFIGNNGRTVFVRTGDKRLPIRPVQMIGVSQMFSTDRVRRQVMARIDRELPVEMERAVRMVMERFGR